MAKHPAISIWTPEYKKEYQRKWREAHREWFIEKDRKWRREHSEELSARSRERLNSSRLGAMEVLGGAVCSRCGFDDIRALQIDHINGGGNKEAIAVRGGISYYNHIIKVNGDGYQVLCANCNWIKRHENNEIQRGNGKGKWKKE